MRLRLFNGSPHERGSFGIAAWTMQLNERLLGLGGLDQAGAQGLAETVFHEGRHVQQWFWMARLRAGQGRSAATITTEMGIPARIAHAARNSPIRPGTVEGVIASGWWESVYGAASPWREATLASITEASWRFTTEQCRFQLFPTPVNQARVVAERAFFRSMHRTYVALPEETDAWATGPGGRAGVTGTAHPMPVPPMDPCAELTRHGRPQPGPTPSPAVDGDRSGAGPASAEGSGEGQQTEIDRPEVSPPTIDGPLHGVLPEDSLPA